jgi:hypothetical protein
VENNTKTNKKALQYIACVEYGRQKEKFTGILKTVLAGKNCDSWRGC